MSAFQFYANLSDGSVLLLERAAVTLSPVKNDVGSISLSIPTVDTKFVKLFADFKKRPVRVETWLYGVKQRKLSFLLEYLGQVTVGDDGATYQQFTGRFLGALLDYTTLRPGATKADSVTPSAFVTDSATAPYAATTAQNAGLWLQNAFSGAVPGNIYSVTQPDGSVLKINPISAAGMGANDAAGVAWGPTGIIQLSIGSTVLSVLGDLASAGMCDWAVFDQADLTTTFFGITSAYEATAGLYNPGTLGVDRSGSVFFLRGRDIGGATREYRYDGLGTTLAVLSQPGQYVVNSNTGATIPISPLYFELTSAAALNVQGRKKTIFQQIDFIYDLASLRRYVLAQLPLVTGFQPLVQLSSISLKSSQPTPVPFRDFDVHDLVSLQAGSGWETYEVYQITVQVDPGGVPATYDLVLGPLGARDPRKPLRAAPPQPVVLPTPVTT